MSLLATADICPSETFSAQSLQENPAGVKNHCRTGFPSPFPRRRSLRLKLTSPTRAGTCLVGTFSAPSQPEIQADVQKKLVERVFRDIYCAIEASVQNLAPNCVRSIAGSLRVDFTVLHECLNCLPSRDHTVSWKEDA